MGFMGREENIVEPEAEPMDEWAGNPDQIEQYQEEDPFADETGGGVLGVEEWTVEGAPEEAEIVMHAA